MYGWANDIFDGAGEGKFRNTVEYIHTFELNVNL